MKTKIAPTSPKYAVENPIVKMYRSVPGELEKPSRGRWSWSAFLVAAIIGLVGGLVGATIVLNLAIQKTDWPIWETLGIANRSNNQTPVVTPASKPASETELSRLNEQVGRVLVSLYQAPASAAGLGERLRQAEDYRGTGVLLTDDGLMAVDASVLVTGQEYWGSTSDGQIATVQLLSRDPISSLGFAKISRNNLPVVGFGVESEIQSGAELLAFSADRLHGPTMLTKLALVGKSIRSEEIGRPESSDDLTRYIKVDPSLTADLPAGTPVVDLKGGLVGIKLNDLDDGSLLPIDVIRSALTSYRSNQEIERPYLGVLAYDLSATVGLNEGETGGKTVGALIAGDIADGIKGVAANSPAEKAGLRAGDLIVSVGGEKITEKSILSELIRAHEIGEQVEVGYLRDGAEQTASATLVKRP